MRNIKEINETIINWNGTFDKLVKQFNSSEYGEMLNETLFDYVEYEYMEEFYTNGDWANFMKFYLDDWLRAQISEGAKEGTDNLFRLWFETV